MNVLVKKATLNGIISIPPSKSYSHRHLIMAMLSKKVSYIEDLNQCDDIYATLNVAKNLGCIVRKENNCTMMDSTNLFSQNNDIMDVYASGSTLRFLIPVCLTQKGAYRFYLRDRLKERSLKVYEDLFKSCKFKREGNILEVTGQIDAGYYEIDGSHSSQFLSGLFLALPLLQGDSEVKIIEPFVSQDYFKMTLSCMKSAGIELEELSSLHYKIKGNQSYDYQSYKVESDASAAVFIKAAKYLGHSIECDMTSTSFQKDAMIDVYLNEIKNGNCIINVRDCPDLVPALALCMALTEGEFEIVGASRLKDKESNRLFAISEVLNTLGANVQVTEDGLKIIGIKKLVGGRVDSYLDHRIAMMATVAGLHCEQEGIIDHSECISKSWPTFYKQIQEVGGAIYEL